MVKGLLPTPEPSLTLHGSIALISSLEFIGEGSLCGNLVSGSTFSWFYLWDLVQTRRMKLKFQCEEKAEKNSTILCTHWDKNTYDEVSRSWKHL